MGRRANWRTEAESIHHQGGRISGARNIHQLTLYDLISKYRPINSVMCEMVANQYRTKTGELSVRLDLKKYFWHKMKPTGTSFCDEMPSIIQQYFNIWRSIWYGGLYSAYGFDFGPALSHQVKLLKILKTQNIILLLKKNIPPQIQKMKS